MHTHAHTRTHTHVHTSALTHVHTHTHTCARTHTHTHTETHSGRVGWRAAAVAGVHGLPPLDDELQQHLDGVVQQRGVHVRHLAHHEVHEARQHVLAPLREVHHQSLQRGERQAPQFLIHVDGQ